MNSKEASKLKVGDVVLWPEGANGCKQSYGIVAINPFGGLLINWDDGQITHSTDSMAIKYVLSAQKQVKPSK